MKELNFEKYLRKPSYLRLSRPFAVTDTVRGYVIAASNQWLLLHCFSDFTPDGYSLVAREKITEIRSGSKEEFFHKMLKAEGLLEGLEKWADLNIDSIDLVCLQLQASGMPVVVECETESGENDEYNVGVIRSANQAELVS